MSKKFFKLAAALTTTALVLTACEKKEDAPPPPPIIAAPEPPPPPEPAPVYGTAVAADVYIYSKPEPGHDAIALLVPGHCVEIDRLQSRPVEEWTKINTTHPRTGKALSGWGWQMRVRPDANCAMPRPVDEGSSSAPDSAPAPVTPPEPSKTAGIRDSAFFKVTANTRLRGGPDTESASTALPAGSCVAVTDARTSREFAKVDLLNQPKTASGWVFKRVLAPAPDCLK